MASHDSPAPPMPHMFGPTTGDRVRLADTDLVIEVEQDLTTYGEEVKFGGGKVIRDGMGQSQATHADGRRRHRHHQRADPRPLGHRQGRCRHQGRAHRRDRQGRQSRTSSRTSPSSIGPGTEVIAGEGKILTAGGFDTPHPLHLPAADRRGADVGRHHHARRRHRPRRRAPSATTCTPGPWHLARMLQAAEAFPMNLGFSGKGNASLPGGPRRDDRRPAPARSSCTRTGARRRPRSTTASPSPTTTTSR